MPSRASGIYYTGVIPVGGYQFTNDIALSFSTPFDAAEAIKLEHGSAEFQPASAGEQILVPVIGRDKQLKVSRLEICQLVRERAMELARMIKVKLDSERMGDAEDSVLVLTGGASNMPGFRRTRTEERRHRSAPWCSRTCMGPWSLPNLRDPVYATAVGTLLWG